MRPCPAKFLLIALALPLMASSQQQRLPSIQVTEEEIGQFVEELRQHNPPMDVPLNFQGHTATRDTKDQAPEDLFQDLRPSDLSQRSDSVRKLLKLYDNYEPQTGEPEQETAEEASEIRAFLDEVLQSQPMQQLQSFLRQKDFLPARNPSTFGRFLEQIWFGQYSRARGQPDSSGFEHVFIGEYKNGEVSGLHNWIRFLYLEKNARARFDYKGFLVKRENIFGSVKFTWSGNVKPTGSFLIGTLPEFDFALYTFCFIARRGRSHSCNFEIDGCPFVVTSFDLVQRDKVFIGSMYPTAGRMTAECRERINSRRTGGRRRT